MAQLIRIAVALLCLAALAFTQTSPPSVGSGSPNAAIQARFVAAAFRNNFLYLVSQPPIADVHRLGSTGLVQEFQDVKKTTGVKYALVLADQNNIGFVGDVIQVYPDLYAYYTAIGVNTVGYPTQDTQSCPGVANCTYQNFSLNYELFAITSGNPNGTQFSVSGAIYSKWTALGGIPGALGIVSDIQRAITSPAKSTANGQLFAGGAVYNITSGVNSGQTFAVLGSVYTLYQSAGGPAGSLGLPTSDETVAASGVHTQTFEGGRVQYTVGNTPVVLFPVNEVDLSPSGPLSLQFGQTVTVTETGFDVNGVQVSGRSVSWATSNGHAVTVTFSGNVATLHAVGSGTATITATSEGKNSSPLLVSVTSPCCQVGDGAPTTAVQQAFQDAVVRNRITVLAPGPNPVVRLSAGYAQDLLSPDRSTHYLIAKADSSGIAYVVTGPFLAAYTQSGGPAGSLGFPLSDVSAGGTQIFQNGALGGSPLQTVTGAILAKWASLQYEAGPAGAPSAAATAFTTQSAYTGFAQAFAGGVIYGVANSNRAGQGFFITGLILGRYLALGGPAGALGLPLTDEFITSGVHRQNFENGYVDYSPGATAAQEHLVPRSPAISANPATALAGSILHVSVTGFSNGATVRISVTGQPDFTVTTPNGSYEWDIYTPSAARSGIVAIHAVDTGTAATADGAYTVKSLADARPQITKGGGDNQTGAPGSTLPIPLAVVVNDGTGAPIPNTTVTFSASPSASVTPASVRTDAQGRALASFRLPASQGVAAVTARALGQIAIFNAQATGSSSLANFPQFAQTSYAGLLGAGPATIAQNGALLTAAAAVIRFYQNGGVLPAAHGLADPAALNQTLTSSGGFVSDPATGEQIVNLWALGGFTGGGLDVSVESPDLATVTGLVAGGDPVLLSLSLGEDGSPAGGTAVVVTGLGANGALQILDPNPAFGQTSLASYLNGFVSQNHSWKATVLSAARLLPRIPSSTGFLVAAVASPASALPSVGVSSAVGPCSAAFTVQDATPSPQAGGSSFSYCSGDQPVYQVNLNGAQPYHATLIDLAPGGVQQDVSGSSPASYTISRTGGFLAANAPTVKFEAAAILNAASFLPSISPGEIVTVFGSGLMSAGAGSQVSVGGRPATVLFVTPFQLNAVIPVDLAVGSSTLTISNGASSASQPIEVAVAAPGIFILSTPSDGAIMGAVVNPDGSVNGPTSPAPRGGTVVVYGTGLGAVTPNGPLSTTVLPVAGSIDGAPAPAAFAGLAPGFIGLYQVNLSIPSGMPPSLTHTLLLVENGVLSNRVPIAIQ